MDIYDERLWELYKNYCHQNKLEPRVDRYLLWIEEAYDETEPAVG